MSAPVVYLSKRNLLALLSKLERVEQGEDSFCSIVKYQSDKPEYQQTMKQITVIAVGDEEYYSALDRPAGLMVEEDEKNLPAPSTGTFDFNRSTNPNL